MSTKFGNADFVRHFAEGSARGVLSNRSIINQGYVSPGITFYRFVVLDVISDPHELFSNTQSDDVALKIAYWRSLGVTNLDLAPYVPRNTVIAQRLNDANSSPYEAPMFLFPFFPSHLALPCKPGEHVWVMFESKNDKDLGFWFCKISEYSFVEDVNHTHAPRALDKTFFPGTIDVKKGRTDPEYHFRPGMAVTTENDGSFTGPETVMVNTNDEEFYEKLLSDSDASKIMAYEPVPRFKKRPGDVALEGSNNTLIVLGTDRTGPVSDVEPTPDEARGKRPKKLTADVDTSAGTIDIVAGRGQTPKTSGKIVSSKRILDKTIFRKEIGKGQQEIVKGEGDPDWISDKSRVLVSQRTRVDKNLQISEINKGFDVADGESGDAAVLLKSDKIRVIGRKDAQILVKDDAGQDVTTVVAKSTGDLTIKVKNTSIKIDNKGNITMDAEGDVTVNPKGIVKLGSDSASLKCARVTDDVTANNALSSWMLSVNAALATKIPNPYVPPVAPGTPPLIIGDISTGSDKVFVK